MAKTELDNVEILEHRIAVYDRAASHRVIDAAQTASAHALVDQMMKRGLITYTREAPTGPRQVLQIKATIGIVAPGPVAAIEDRISERQMTIATETATEVHRYISMNYPNGIAPRDIPDAMKAALAIVQKRRTKTG